MSAHRTSRQFVASHEFGHFWGDCVARLFCPSERVRLIQNRASMRNVDSRIRSLRFDLLRIFILELLHSDFCNAIGGAKRTTFARYERSVLNQCDIGWSMELAGRTILIVVAG